MPPRSPIAWMTVLFLVLLAGTGRAAGFVDAAERYVAVPDRPGIGVELREDRLEKFPYRPHTIAPALRADGAVAH